MRGKPSKSGAVDTGPGGKQNQTCRIHSGVWSSIQYVHTDSAKESGILYNFANNQHVFLKCKGSQLFLTNALVIFEICGEKSINLFFCRDS